MPLASLNKYSDARVANPRSKHDRANGVNRRISGGISMFRAGVDAILYQDSLSSPTVISDHESEQSFATQLDGFVPTQTPPSRYSGPRRTPRKSLIVVLPANHVVSADLVVERLSGERDNGEVDVILACAGQPTSIAVLQRKVRDLQILLAPAGTSGEDLRELAMNQAPGDIVTLLSGTPA
jgi:hypothetical protein